MWKALLRRIGWRLFTMGSDGAAVESAQASPTIAVNVFNAPSGTAVEETVDAFRGRRIDIIVGQHVAQAIDVKSRELLRDKFGVRPELLRR